MAETTYRAVALLAIHPRYAEAIVSGRKRVEFRKASFRREVSHVVIYSTSPVMRVVGFFEIGSVQRGSPSDLWTKYAHVGGIDRKSFVSYYAGRKRGVALEVARVWALEEPIRLTQLRKGLRAPQSYRYLAPHCLNRLRRGSKPEARLS